MGQYARPSTSGVETELNHEGVAQLTGEADEADLTALGFYVVRIDVRGAGEPLLCGFRLRLGLGW